mmetsp:Transcript_156726/g.480848  ORF Transcript_156726/g.480848 Transcript_156726/m.480848 type:complete len:160 (+) Transcript_156726:52-531(+)|eukprot:CAMPEP_0204560572 /NCGR_PEP_ID=MMETSP0661-20131031/32698_1 /ASSEMBLY_ACC=CAM_ASM_000606 /TAXON_ID=109239 /ORGANISM="Alexandrium margalefi, Strain AMGDE01CS-322" /LENGTH=159 /DNA_ID=CAMNT_0051567919 /DNA_START=56 /DNA_END=535 /DNA_ORIENTATION=-
MMAGWCTFLAVAFGARTALALNVASRELNLADVPGAYADPNHPGHLRHIKLEGEKGTIHSTDDGVTFWQVPITVDSAGHVLADFSSKGGPKDLSGQVTEVGIKWSDGNVWEKVSAKGITADRCKVACQRFGFRALGKAFANITMPQPCVPKCDEVYPKL